MTTRTARRTRTARTARRALALPCALGLAASLVSCGTQVGSSGSGGGSALPVLHIGERMGTPATVGTSTGPDDPYPLVGTLPSGPAQAPVHRFGSDPVPAATVTALATAVGLSGTVQRHARGVVVSSPAGELRVRDGGSWSYWRADDLCPPTRVDVESADPNSVAMGCAVSPTDATIVAAPPKNPEITAAPVLDAAGVGALPARVDDRDATSDVTVQASIGGARVSGLSTVVTVDARGVLSAYGVLGQPAEGPAYPLLPAATALGWLRAQPRPEIAISCAVGQTCRGVGPQKVTGAELGLLPVYDGPEQILVPAWLFTIEGSDQPAAVVAVADEFLAAPEVLVPSGSETPVPPGTGDPGAGSSGGSGGSSTDPGLSAEPVPVPTASDLPLPVQGYISITSASLSPDGRTLTLTGWGGICDRYAGQVREDSRRVYALITSTPQSDGNACAAMAKVINVDVTLAAPLGSRTVVDETSNSERVVPVS
jgi:hypothetical protein